jgi:hypothetical protein
MEMVLAILESNGTEQSMSPNCPTVNLSVLVKVGLLYFSGPSGSLMQALLSVEN